MNAPFHALDRPCLIEACLDRREFSGVRRLAAQALRDLGTAASLDALLTWTGDAETAAAARNAIAAIRSRRTP